MTRPPAFGSAAMIGVLLLANLLSWLWAWLVFQDRPALLTAALLAWMFGLRHAFDADHIAAIDNVVRKQVQTGRRAWDGGLFFALGHSLVVLIACVGIAALPAMGGMEAMRHFGETWGTPVSSAFLLLFALANVITLRRLWRGGGDDVRPAGGAMTWILAPVRRLSTRGWHMLPVGFLFGLGFDTASEIALLALTGQQAAAGLPPSAVLVFPALFASGMVLLDTADSAVMTWAYQWAGDRPARQAGCNIIVTALSAAAALLIAGLQLIPAMGDALSLAGFALTAVLLSAWGAAVFLYRRTAAGGLDGRRAI